MLVLEGQVVCVSHSLGLGWVQVQKSQLEQGSMKHNQPDPTCRTSFKFSMNYSLMCFDISKTQTMALRLRIFLGKCLYHLIFTRACFCVTIYKKIGEENYSFYSSLPNWKVVLLEMILQMGKSTFCTSHRNLSLVISFSHNMGK